MNTITIICKNNRNPVTEVTELLAQKDINISDINFQQFGENAFLSISLEDYDAGLSHLLEAGFHAVPDDIVLVRGEDRPGALAKISRTLTEENVQIRSLTLMEINSSGAILALATNDNETVRKLFADQIVN